MGIVKFIIEKKLVIILILLALIYLYPIFQNGFFLSHDSVTHTARASMYAKALAGGDFFPRWAKDANFGFGSPFFIFYYPLTGILVALPHFLGVTYETSFLALNVLSFIIGPLFFYLWIKNAFNSKLLGFVSALFFMVLPYRFLTMYVRSGIGELLAFSLLPLIFYLVDRLSKKTEFKTILMFASIYALIILSHNGVSLIFTPIILLYSFLKNRKAFSYSLVSAIFGLGLSAYFWMPALFESKYTNGLLYFWHMYRNHFPPLLSYIYSGWGFGADVNAKGGLSPQIGIFGFLVLIASSGLVFIKKFEQKRIIIFWIAMFLLGLFISTSYSSFLWQNSDFLKKFQFPWRFNMVPSFAAAALFPFVLQSLNKKRLAIGFIILVSFYSLQFVKVAKNISYPDKYYEAYEGSTYFHNEGTTIWSAGDPSKRAQNQIDLIGGKGSVDSLTKNSLNHSFTVKAKTDVSLRDNTIYFPGWEVYVDGAKTPIQFQDTNSRGLITFQVPQGNHKVEVKFSETKIRLISDIISILSLVFLISAVFLLRLRKIS